MERNNALIAGLVAAAILAAAPAYADVVLVSTVVEGDSPSAVLAMIGNRTAGMFDGMVAAGAAGSFLDMLEFDLDVVDHEWVAAATFVAFVPDPADSGAVAAAVSSYDRTAAYVMARHEAGNAKHETTSYNETNDAADGPGVVITQLVTYTTGERLVVSGNVVNTGDKPAENIRIDSMTTNNLAIRQVFDGGNVSVSIVGASDSGVCHDMDAGRSGNAFAIGGTCSGGAVVLSGLTTGPNDAKSVAAGGSSAFRVVVDVRNAPEGGLDLAVSGGDVMSLSLAYDVLETRTTDTRTAMVVAR